MRKEIKKKNKNLNTKKKINTKENSNAENERQKSYKAYRKQIAQ